MSRQKPKFRGSARNSADGGKLWALEITGGDYRERSRERQRDRAAQSNNIKFVIIMRYVNKFTFSYGLYACIYAVIMYYFRNRRAHNMGWTCYGWKENWFFFVLDSVRSNRMWHRLLTQRTDIALQLWSVGVSVSLIGQLPKGFNMIGGSDRMTVFGRPSVKIKLDERSICCWCLPLSPPQKKRQNKIRHRPIDARDLYVWLWKFKKNTGRDS